MKNIHRYIIYMLGLVCVSHQAYSQMTAAEYYQKSREYYKSLDSFTVNIRMTAHDGTEKNKAQTMEGTIWKSGPMYRVKYPMVEILDNGKDYINCYMETQNIYVAPSASLQELPLTLPDIQGLIRKASRTDIKTENNITYVTLYFSAGNTYKQMTISYQLPEYGILKIEMLYSRPLQYDYFDAGSAITKFDVELYGLDVTPFIPSRFFESSQYYTAAGNTYTGSGNYKSFKVLKNAQ